MDSPDLIDSSNREKDELIISYKKVFSGTDGERVLTDLMRRYGVFFGTVDPKGNPNTMYYNEGQRSVVVEILECVDCDLDKIRKKREDSLSDFRI